MLRWLLASHGPCHTGKGVLARPSGALPKGEGHSPSKIRSGPWRLIWNTSEVDRLIDGWIHSDQCHLDVLTHQSDEGARASLATGCGHDDAGLAGPSETRMPCWKLPLASEFTAQKL